MKLVWLTAFRAVAASLILAATTLPLLARPTLQELSRQESTAFAVIGIVYGLTLVYSLLLRRGVVGRRAAYVQVLGDVVLAGALVYFTGGAESPFTFAFSLAVIAAAILLDQRGAITAAFASTVAFSVLIGLDQTNLFRGNPGSAVIAPGRLVFLWITNVLAQLLVAALASYLSRQLAAAGGALRARETDLAELVLLQEQILSAMPSGLVTCDADGQVAFVNRAGRSILEIDPLSDVDVPLEKLFPGIYGLPRDGRRQELTVETAEGPRTLGLTVTGLEAGRGLLIVFQDLTELRRIEKELKRVDQLAALGSLSAELAHEVRNPLAAMRGAAQLLAQDEPPPTTQRRLTGILVREADRLSSLVDNFLRFARPPDPRHERCDLGGVVAEVLEMVRLDGSHPEVQLESNLRPVEVWVDPAQLKQVLLNLVRNAIHAARGGGRVRVEVRDDEASGLIRVWDSAGAVSEQNLGRIFEPFFTTRQGGTGLGLSAAHSIVRAHRGQIHVRSSPAEGTEFVVELPKGPPEVELREEVRRASAGGR